MNNALIPVFSGEIAGSSVQLVDARPLHGFLEVGKRFASWINERINEYGFQENQDFIAISQKREIGHGRGKTDYHITLGMAKELAMVERNEKGREIRRYFIECERRLLDQKPNALRVISKAISSEQQNAIQQIVASKAQGNRNTFAYLWSRFNNHFGLGSYKQLPAEKFSEAVAYLLAMPIEGKSRMVAGDRFTDTSLRNYSHAREKISSARSWACDTLPENVRQPLLDSLEDVERSVVKGFTEIDEALIHLYIAVSMLKRWAVRVN